MIFRGLYNGWLSFVEELPEFINNRSGRSQIFSSIQPFSEPEYHNLLTQLGLSSIKTFMVSIDSYHIHVLIGKANNDLKKNRLCAMDQIY